MKDSTIKYQSTKTYNHSIGLSTAFRQWRADSHCKYLHGYAIKVKFTFEATELDIRNWVVDFGSLKSLKGWLEGMLDHKVLVAADDPKITIFRELEIAGLAQIVILPKVGCEALAEIIFRATEVWIRDNGYSPRTFLRRVEISEHEGNSAIVERVDD